MEIENGIATVAWAERQAALADPAVNGIILKVSAQQPVQLAASPAERYAQIMARQQELRALETSGKPIVALMDADSDLEVALACHFRVGESAAALQAGAVPSQGATQRLGRLLGVAKALPHLLEGRPLEPDAIGGHAQAMAWLQSAQAHASQPWDRKGFKLPGGATSSAAVQNIFVGANAKLGHLPAARAILSCLYEGLGCDIDTGLQIEARYAALTEG